MSLKCEECERDIRGGHSETCSRYRGPVCSRCFAPVQSREWGFGFERAFTCSCGVGFRYLKEGERVETWHAVYPGPEKLDLGPKRMVAFFENKGQAERFAERWSPFGYVEPIKVVMNG